MGLVAIAGTVFQVCIGLYKYIVKVRDDRVFATWHGTFGPVLWTLIVVTAALGILQGLGLQARLHGNHRCAALLAHRRVARDARADVCPAQAWQSWRRRRQWDQLCRRQRALQDGRRRVHGV